MDEAEILVLQKKLKKLKQYKGQGTQLISLYLPSDADRSSVTKQLTDEISQSSNIKSAQTRKNVQAALKRISNYLKQIDFKLPENGLVLFSGEVSTNPSKSDVILVDLSPPKPLKTKLYWCDSTFHLDPLIEMAQTDQIYGLVSVDKREGTIAILRGKSLEILANDTSGVPGKTRAGGQCLEKNSLVSLENGEIKSISEIAVDDKLISADLNKFNLKNSKVTDAFTKNRKKQCKIITKYPRFEIESSLDHTFFVFKENKVVEKKAKDLSEDDVLLFSENISVKSKLQKIDSKQYFNSYILKESGIKLIKQKKKAKNLTNEQFAEKLNISKNTINSLERKAFDPKLNTLKNLCNLLNIEFNDFIKNHTTQNNYHYIKLPNILDKDLSQFLGYLLGDGSIEEDRITFFEGDLKLIEYYKNKFNRYFKLKSNFTFRKTKNYYQLRLTSRPLVRLVRNEFFENKSSLYSLIPSKVLMSDNDVLAKFLKGLFDADGYVSGKKIGISLNNKNLIKQIQIALLRFSIISSFLEYDNNKNKYSNNPKYTIQITDKESISLFKKKIGFTLNKKQEKIKEIIKQKDSKSNVRQILFSGTKIRELIENNNLNLEKFPKVNSFFRNERLMSKYVFYNSIIKNISNKNLKSSFIKIYNYNVLPSRISKIEIINKSQKMYDLSVLNKNFISNGLIVHNSAHRFERLREKAAESFFKRIGEKVNALFMNQDKLKGIIVGGPGMTKKTFLEQSDLDPHLHKMILGKIDTSYTGYAGIKEILDKSEDLLQEAGIVKEKHLVDEFLKNIAKNNLATYGFKDVTHALNLGQASKVLLSEDINWGVIKYKCPKCEKEYVEIVKNIDNLDIKASEIESNCPKCKGSTTQVISKEDIFDYFLELAKSTSAEVELISTKSQEGHQFFQTFGGIACLLRFKT